MADRYGEYGELRYNIYAADDMDREHEESASTSRGAFLKAKKLLRRFDLDFVIVTDLKYGINMTLYPGDGSWTVAHRFHDYSWQVPEAGLVTVGEGRMISRGEGTLEAREAFRQKRASAEQAALGDVGRAGRSFGESVEFGGEVQY